jgi:transposase
LHTRADAWGPPSPRADGLARANATFAISCGDPQRNKNYRVALFGTKKSDPLEARAAARYALSERPAPVKPLSQQARALRQVATRLQAACRQRTRLVNQLHHLLVLAFPELALLVKDLATGWVLEVLHRYPTAALLAVATEAELGDIPYLPEQQIPALLERARSSIASLQGDAVAELVRDQLRQLREVRARQKRLEKMLVAAYRALPDPNHLDTIIGIGQVTAAILTAFISDIDRFDTPGKLVAYFGTLPIEVASGVDRDGKPRGPKRYVMSRRGNDLVRRYLWMAALSAARYNPAVRALYARVVAKHPDHKAIAVGHAMRKLLHLAFAVWKTGKPFDGERWAKAAHLDECGPSDAGLQSQDAQAAAGVAEAQRDLPRSPERHQAAGLRNPDVPERKEVTAAGALSLPEKEAASDNPFIDFSHLKRQLPMLRLLDQLGLAGRLRGQGPQKRCPCPIHRGDNRGQRFSVNLDDNVFCCHDKACGKKGDVIDLWANLHGMSLRDAALDLVRTFQLDPGS